MGRDSGKDFAYVSRDKVKQCHVSPQCPSLLTCVSQVTRRHVCHVFRCQLPARTIANALRDICKKILIERSLAQSSSKLTEKLISARDREHPARARSARPTRFETKPRLFLLTLESR